ncbi:hypothetical protein ACFYSJ_31925 [Streptomyces sp. NPDC005248]|uniref:hypothetical protein n=1 Tax=unclassified Streptomyces TaxID=2593676 RepID=UPI0033A743DC
MYDFPEDRATPSSRCTGPAPRTSSTRPACRGRPNPLTGWESERQPYTSFRSGKADSPGYTAEQATEVARYQAELVRLSVEVSTHPYWSTLDGGAVAARMTLKHAHEQPADEAA